MNSQMTRSLRVSVQSHPCGTLSVERQQYVFNYDAGATEAVSLTMPVRAQSYVQHDLHPLFQMHLPEGYLLSIIETHLAKLGPTDDFGLLSLLAPSRRGHVSFDVADGWERYSIPIETLRHPTQDLFETLVTRFALRSPLSGVQPKVLAQVENKATLTTDDYIVKAWGETYPELAINEFICMSTVAAAGIPVPEFFLSEDDALFVMKRFDLDSRGQSLGFEDLCVLQGKTRNRKYEGSYEGVLKTLKCFISAAHQHDAMEQMFKLMVLNTLLQNGDGHLKNFGVLYTNHSDIRLAPAYDVVCTTCYIAEDVPALTLNGSKKWWPKPWLLNFAQTACNLTPHDASRLYQTCIDAIEDTTSIVEKRLTHASTEAQAEVLKHIHQLMQDAPSKS